MPLQKQTIPLNFAQGIDTKTDPLQISIGKFLSLNNVSFDKQGSMNKRNGFQQLPSLPDTSSGFLTTFNGNLTAIGRDLKALASGANQWYSKGLIYPLQLSTLPLIRNSTNQSQCDAAIAPNGLVCTVYTDNVTVGSSTQSVYKYAIADGTTGQNVISPQQIQSTLGTVTYFPRVFPLNNYFVIVNPVQTGVGAFDLQYAVINSLAPAAIGSVSTFTSSFGYSTSDIGSVSSFDGVVANGTLYVSWNGASNTGIRAAYLNSQLNKSSEFTLASSSGTIFSVTADSTGSSPIIWTSVYSCGSHSGYTVATDNAFNTVFAAKQFITTASVSNLTSVASNGINRIYIERNNWYSYNSPPAQTNFLQRTDALVISSASVSVCSIGATQTVARGLGIASKAFAINSVSYLLAAYGSPYQSTYFLINSTGSVVSKLAYGNGNGFTVTGPPQVNLIGSTASVAYLVKDLVSSVNKGTQVGSTTPTAAIYSQTGVNLANFTFGPQNLVTSEIAQNLHLNGGFLWSYDGYQPVEHMFHLYPDNVFPSTGGGNLGQMSPQTYFYQTTYEWADNQGNAYRSAPSIPVSIVLGSGSSYVSLNVPMLRLTYKSQVKVCIYRWSQAQQVYYQVTSLAMPTLNNPNIDSFVFTDTTPDSQILGNNIIYTNGGEVENDAWPAVTAITQFDTRLWGINAEDPNQLLFSKQVIESVPVETSSFFTLYVSPSESAQGSTGPMKCLSPLDDKLIIFKRNAIYYINGTGPDNTGANSQYSQPTFITSTIGCQNQNSIVMTPNGLMFQSDKGIWLLGRDLSTTYVGAPVEQYNTQAVLSAETVPGTNQVRFTMNSGVTLVYDYYFNQWGTYSGIPGISSTLYQNMHTFINASGMAYQEAPGTYVDGSSPVLMSFTSSWMNFASLQGYQRAYWLTLLATYQSPHRYAIGVAYDYDASATQLVTITPDNYSGNWGSGSSWGAVTTWGGTSTVEQWQINFQRQQCQSFQLTFNEYYDPSRGVAPGAGLTLSGMDLVVGIKKGYARDIPPSHRRS